MANNPYVNKVVYGNTTVMDISDTTATASDVAQGKYFYSASGQKVEGTASGGGGSAITVIDETLPNGATAKHITAVDISSDTVDAAHLAQGYTAHAADGTALVGTMSGGSSVTVESLSVTANGTYTAPTGKAYSPVVVDVPTGGGGASNFVTGTFTGTTTGAIKATKISYEGTGSPVAFAIFPSEGVHNPNGTFYGTIQRYATISFFAVRSILPIINTEGKCITTYKNSDSVARSYTYTSTSYSTTEGLFAGAVSASNARTVASMLISGSDIYLETYIASSSYGFMANIEYTYIIYFA